MNDVAVEVSITSILGTTHISVDEFLRLTAGDVITLDNKCNEPIKTNIGDESYFYGKPGIIGKYRGVQILDIIDKDVDNYE